MDKLKKLLTGKNSKYIITAVLAAVLLIGYLVSGGSIKDLIGTVFGGDITTAQYEPADPTDPAQSQSDSTPQSAIDTENPVNPDSISESDTSEPPETSKTPDTTKAPETTAAPETTVQQKIAKNGKYTSKEDVAEYIHTYGCLPSNFVTKTTARSKGWEGGSLEKYYPGCSIGGDRFGNNEGLLPNKKGRQYYECDIDTMGASSRGAKRIVYSNDGLIYYTEDHYEHFTLLYGNP